MNARDILRGGMAGLLLAVCVWVRAEGPAGTPPEDDSEESKDSELNVPALYETPPVRSPVFQAPKLPPEPVAGEGRLRLEVGGNRQWCTYRDDRVVQPPVDVGGTKVQPTTYNPVFTFGYQFTIAAVARARPSETMMLYESPIIRTAVMRQAAKLGRGAKKPPGPTIIVPQTGKKRATAPPIPPSALIPYWQEAYACATLPEAFEFDLKPGAYDIYMAFDILGRSGGWSHRSIGFLTDIVVEEGRRTRLDGRVDMIGGGRRTVELLSSSLMHGAEAGAGAGP